MSGKRGPSDSSFGPTSEEVPCRFTWSEMRTSRPGPVVGVDPARRVRHDERADAEPAEHADAERDAIGCDPLVEMRPPAHDRDRYAAERPEHERSGMSHRRRRPASPGMSEYGISTRVVELVGEAAEPAAEHDADAGLEVGLLADPATASSTLTPIPPRRGCRSARRRARPPPPGRRCEASPRSPRAR